MTGKRMAPGGIISTEAPRAVIWVSAAEDPERWQAASARYVERHGYLLVSVIRDGGDGASFDQAEGLVRNGEADLIVTAVRRLVPPRTVECGDEEASLGGLPVSPSRRRPALVERGDVFREAVQPSRQRRGRLR